MCQVAAWARFTTALLRLSRGFGASVVRFTSAQPTKGAFPAPDPRASPRRRADSSRLPVRDRFRLHGRRGARARREAPLRGGGGCAENETRHAERDKRRVARRERRASTRGRGGERRGRYHRLGRCSETRGRGGNRGGFGDRRPRGPTQSPLGKAISFSENEAKDACFSIDKSVPMV